MNRFAAVLLILIGISSVTLPTVAQTGTRNSYPVDRASAKALKKQQKAQKKYWKRQQKAQNKMFKESQKKSTRYPQHQY